MEQESLYQRLGACDGIAGFANELLSRLQPEAQLARFWENRSDDGISREKQLLIDYLSSVTGRPLLYTDRDMKTTHQGMQISESDWAVFLGHADATMEVLKISTRECEEVVAFVLGLKESVVDSQMACSTKNLRRVA